MKKLMLLLLIFGMPIFSMEDHVSSSSASSSMPSTAPRAASVPTLSVMARISSLVSSSATPMPSTHNQIPASSVLAASTTELPPLIVAARKGDGAQIRALISAGTNINVQDEEGNTALHHAARWGNSSMIKELLSLGARMDVCNMHNETPFFTAVLLGHRAVIRLLRGRYTDVNIPSTRFGTLLSTAIKNSSWSQDSYWKQVAQYLIHAGAHINHYEGDNHETALHMAARKGNSAIITCLLDRGAYIDARNKHGETPFFIAVSNRRWATAKLLQKHGADIKARVMAASSLVTAIRASREDTVKWLLDHGADIHERDNVDNTPLYTATQQGNVAIMTLLLDRGAQIDARNSHGKTSLFIAVQNGNWDAAELLCKRGADINVRTTEGTLLSIVLNDRTKGNYHKAQIVQWLIDHGIDMRARDNDGRGAFASLLSPVISSRRTLFVSYGPATPLIQVLLGNGVDAYERDRNGMTMLHAAAEYGDIDMLKLLVKRGFDVDVKDNKGNTALHLLADLSGNIAFARMLIANKADIHAKNDEGITPLVIARRKKNNKEIFEIMQDSMGDIAQPLSSRKRKRDVQ